MDKKIMAPNGKYTLLTTCDQASRFGDKIKCISSTEAQPYIAANFGADGLCVGGCTLQESAYRTMLKKAIEAGWKIEEVAR